MNDYTWKCGLEFSSRTTLKTNRPLSPDKVIVDLLDGSRFRVDAVYPANATDREFSSMPETVVHAWPAGRVTDDELMNLRARAEYEPREYSYPLEAIVFDL